MSEGRRLIPVFPLNLLPFPGEWVPLHIFEPRYRQLLKDAEESDMEFGIYFNHVSNEAKLGSIMKLERVIKRYPTGESDIVVKCSDIFVLRTLLRNYKDKQYPGGWIEVNKETQLLPMPDEELTAEFQSYLTMRRFQTHKAASYFEIANELSLDPSDRYKFLRATIAGRRELLIKHLRYHVHILLQEERSKDVFHLN